MPAKLLRRLGALCALLVVAATLVVTAPASPALADPEGGTKQLRDALESATKGYVDAKNRLAASQKRQKQLKITLSQATAEAKTLEGQVAAIAARSYREGRFTTVSMLLNASSPDAFLERAYRLDMIAMLDAQTLTRYRDEVSLAQRAKQAIDLEVNEQAKQVTVMAKKKKEAEAALAAAGGGQSSSGFTSTGSASAKPARRNPDGSWPRESCSVNDPTSSGCITPRMYNVYLNARAAGFTHYTVCWSQRSSGEHPLGRACDFSANATTFKDVAASGSDKLYGDRLAAWAVRNADRLGIMYVIWYRQIWLPSSGWKSYSASGGPSVVHTNHVHVSVL